MLSICLNRAANHGFNPVLIMQDMRNLQVGNDFDCAICCTDSINYLLCKNDLFETFLGINQCLKPGGLFCFDVNTTYKYKTLLRDSASIYDDGEVFCSFSSKYNEKRGICNFDITVFEQKSNGFFERYDENHKQKSFSNASILGALKNCGFTLLDTFDDYTDNHVDCKTLRTLYIAEKI